MHCTNALKLKPIADLEFIETLEKNQDVKGGAYTHVSGSADTLNLTVSATINASAIGTIVTYANGTTATQSKSSSSFVRSFASAAGQAFAFSGDSLSRSQGTYISSFIYSSHPSVL